MLGARSFGNIHGRGPGSGGQDWTEAGAAGEEGRVGGQR